MPSHSGVFTDFIDLMAAKTSLILVGLSCLLGLGIGLLTQVLLHGHPSDG